MDKWKYRYKIKVEYKGTNYSGWQKQKGQTTVQSRLEDAIANFSHEITEVFGSGRTDSGVHSIGQVAHFDLEKLFDANKMAGAFNYYLNKEEISVYDVENLGYHSNFHARFSAKQRSYIYKILQRKHPPTFDSDLVWWLPHKLDVETMQIAAKHLIGTHDLSTFRAVGCQALSPVKTIDEAYFSTHRDFLIFHIKAKSFLYHQVRNIVGSLYEVGRGRWNVKEFVEAFRACDRTKGGITAPAVGLYFDKVEY